MKRSRIVYVYTADSPFVKKDVDILSQEYDLSVFQFNPKGKWSTLWYSIREIFFLLFRLPGARLSVVQFGGYHSYFPAWLGKIFRVPCLVILGGSDCVALPDIGYGNFSKKGLAWFTCRSYHLAAHLSPVHESLAICDYKYLGNENGKQGYLAFCPGVKTPCTTIYNGYDASVFSPSGQREERLFLCIARLDKRTYFLKGVDLFLEAARRFPDARFLLIGGEDKVNLENVPANFELIPFMSNTELAGLLSRSRFYMQLSMSEGFPNALCEAMLCGCVPIASGVGAIPYIVSDTGFILKRKDPDELEKIIREALEAPLEELSKKARQRIADNFPIGRRERELTELCRKIIAEQ